MDATPLCETISTYPLKEGNTLSTHFPPYYILDASGLQEAGTCEKVTAYGWPQGPRGCCKMHSASQLLLS